MTFSNKLNNSSALSLLFLAFSAFFGSLSLLFENKSYYMEWQIFNSNSCSFEMTLIFDWMSLLFLAWVCFIAAMVLYYSESYMKQDKTSQRFTYLVLSFVLTMALLIMSPNLVSILIGWDGLGLVSYVLILYYQNEKAANAGMITILSNRVGDVAVLLSIAFISYKGGFNFPLCTKLMPEISLFFVSLAGITKSAQVPFSVWLPAAMAAPTPVSALVHSSTLVTAGVYLLIRFNISLPNSMMQTVILLSASLTMLMANLNACWETDLKKVIALSTLSQLSIMISILALNLPYLAFFHLLTHALFKALLFLCAGSIIHNSKSFQDIRFMGGLISFMPLTTTMMNLASLALCGLPFLSGFYSKDLILETAFSCALNKICFWTLILTTGLTVSYSFRLILLTLSGEFHQTSSNFIQDNDKTMSTPMMNLSLSATVGGTSLSWLILPYQTLICLPIYLKLMVLSISLLGGLMGYLLNKPILTTLLKTVKYQPFIFFISSMWFMPPLSMKMVTISILKQGKFYHQMGDQGWSEVYGGQGISFVLRILTKWAQISQTNEIKIHMTLFVFWIMILVSLTLFNSY